MTWKSSLVGQNHEGHKKTEADGQRLDVTASPDLKRRENISERDRLFTRCRDLENHVRESASEALKTCSEKALQVASSSIIEAKQSASAVIAEARQSADQQILRIIQSINEQNALPSDLQSLVSSMIVSTTSSSISPLETNLVLSGSQTSYDTSSGNKEATHSSVQLALLSPSVFAGIIIACTILSSLVTGLVTYFVSGYIKTKKSSLGDKKEKANGYSNEKSLALNDRNNKVSWGFKFFDKNSSQGISNQRQSLTVGGPGNEKKNTTMRKNIKSQASVLHLNHPTPFKLNKYVKPTELDTGSATESHEENVRRSSEKYFTISSWPENTEMISKKSSSSWLPKPKQPFRNTIEWLEAREKYLQEQSEEQEYLPKMSFLDTKIELHTSLVDHTNSDTISPVPHSTKKTVGRAV